MRILRWCFVFVFSETETGEFDVWFFSFRFCFTIHHCKLKSLRRLHALQKADSQEWLCYRRPLEFLGGHEFAGLLRF